MDHQGGIKTAITVVGTAASYMWGGVDAALRALIALATIDYITGVAAAWVCQELDSLIGARGIATKVGMFLVIAVGNIIDQTGVLGDPILKTVATWWYVGNESLSIVENLAEIGVPIPERVVSALVTLKGRGGPRR